jgi:hypothetical protein
MNRKREGRMDQAFAIAFEEWERRYREDPRGFMNEVERLLGHTPRTYGEGAGAYFVALLNELSTRDGVWQPWNTITRDVETPPL